MTEEPRPASLENTPRLHPWVMACWMAIPAAPPATALLPKAKRKIAANMAPTLLIWVKNTISEPMMYSTAMNGTTRSATVAMRCRPPMTINAARIISTMPQARETTLMPPTVAVTPPKNADFIFRTILLICPILPMPKDARMAKMENRTARTLPMVLQCFLPPRPSFR